MERSVTRGRRVGVFDIALALGGLLLVVLAVQNAGPALAALRGEGVPGTFTARRLDCIQHPGHEQCNWVGTFRSRDGRDVREEIGFYGSERGTFTPGATSPAFDTGRRGHVYGPGGSNEWVVVAALLAAGLGLIARPLLGVLAMVRAARPAGPG
ncbi:hypothetical protein Sme01_66480 [Sphaerisporangium melleum]|uniref:Uncharacterized protein n=1 Tax=Sphaerisporangium melleum TaxID=321316 RepID=A0A917VR64_9ACTN|nr:hypothetical protein [Sphaerisporangium melleum]GGL06308.1 hypothetical protein GCM10007964_55710 [Sphaerisporangium melleum]GII74172.1 hypothetical protein Sme01_66480 [Sphaerisporangium melleum]